MYSGDYYSCPLYCYPTALLTNLFGNDPTYYRFEAALFGSLFILIIFFVTQNLFDRKTALLSAFFTTFSYWQIAWSRQARWYTLFECFFWLSILSFSLAKNSYGKNGRWVITPWITTVVLTALAMVSHPLGYLLPVIFIFWLYIEKIQKKEFKWKNIFISLVVMIGLYILCDFFLRVSLFAQLEKFIQPVFLLPQYALFLLRSYWLFICFFTALVLVNTDSLKRLRQLFNKNIYFLLSILFSYVFFMSFLGRDLNYGHIFQVTPVFFILGSFAIVEIYKKIKTIVQKIAYIGIIIIVFFSIGGGVIVPSDTYFLETDNPNSFFNPSPYSLVAQPDWNTAYAYIKENRKKEDIIISTVPQFNKIFLNEPGYWLKYKSKNLGDFEKDGKEIYVGATSIHSLDELVTLTSSAHGFIVFEKVFNRNVVSKETTSYIELNFSQVFYKKTGDYNEIFVYKY